MKTIVAGFVRIQKLLIIGHAEFSRIQLRILFVSSPIRFQTLH